MRQDPVSKRKDIQKKYSGYEDFRPGRKEDKNEHKGIFERA